MTSKDKRFRLGQYLIQEEIGSGGFGIVRKGFDESTGETVAIKILDKVQLGMYEMTQCVKKEIELLTALKHPNIVRGKEVLISKRKIFLVMEFVDGGDAHTALTKRLRYPEDEARVLFRSLMEAMVYCHSRGIYHRDLKLENMLLTSTGQMKLCDFGLAFVKDLNKNKTDLCKTAVGTEDFSCPEIVQSIPYRGEKADMWSCGVILYSLLAGYFPFEGETPGDIARSVVSCKYTFPRHFSKAAKDLIRGLLAKDPKRRTSASRVLESTWLRMGSPTSASTFVVIKNPFFRGFSSSSRSSKLSISSSRSVDDGDRCRKSWRLFRKGAVIPVNVSVFRISQRFGRHHGTIHRWKGDEDNKLHSFSIFDALGRARIQDFAEILKLMRNKDTGIHVQDRKWRFSTFRACFIGQEAVQWICEKLLCTVEDAVALGQKFHEVGAFHHVCRDHGFKNEYLFYRWIWNDPGYGLVLNGRYTHRALYSRQPERMVLDSLRELLNICRFHQQLHDYRQIEMIGIQQDSRLVTFSNSILELQTAALCCLETDEQIISFLVNLYNMFWIQARIHIGDFEEMDFEQMKQISERLEYIIGGRRITLQNVKNLLLSRFHTTMNSNTAENRRTEERSPMTRTRLRSISQPHHTHGNLIPRSVHPFVSFLISDSSPFSPAIKPVTEKDITEAELQKAAGRYFDKVVEVDLPTRTVRYPAQVGEFRRLLRVGDDQEMVEILTELSSGFDVHDELQGLREVLQLDSTSLVVDEVEDEFLPVSRTIFAPEILSESDNCGH
ncbi:unnamed protein product [Agarophyton chilense]